MSRRSKPAKRVPLADPVYNSVDISKFINRIMRRGKKSLAERIFYSTMTKIEEPMKKLWICSRRLFLTLPRFWK